MHSPEQIAAAELQLTQVLRSQHPWLSDWSVKLQSAKVRGLEHYVNSTHVMTTTRTIHIPLSFGLQKILSSLISLADHAVDKIHIEALAQNSYINSRADKLYALLNSLFRDAPHVLSTVLEDFMNADPDGPSYLDAFYEKLETPVDPFTLR